MDTMTKISQINLQKPSIGAGGTSPPTNNFAVKKSW